MGWQQTTTGKDVTTWTFTATGFVRVLCGFMFVMFALSAVSNLVFMLGRGAWALGLGVLLITLSSMFLVGSFAFGQRIVSIDTEHRRLTKWWGWFGAHWLGGTHDLDAFDHLEVLSSTYRGRTQVNLRLVRRARGSLGIVSGWPSKTDVAELAQAMSALTGLPVRGA